MNWKQLQTICKIYTGCLLVHPHRFQLMADIVINMMSTYSKVTNYVIRYVTLTLWQTVKLAFLSWNSTRCEKKLNYIVVECPQFSMKWYLRSKNNLLKILKCNLFIFCHLLKYATNSMQNCVIIRQLIKLRHGLF